MVFDIFAVIFVSVIVLMIVFDINISMLCTLQPFLGVKPVVQNDHKPTKLLTQGKILQYCANEPLWQQCQDPVSI